MVLSVISKRASMRSCGCPTCPRAQDGFAERVHGALAVHLAHSVELRFEAALQEEIAEAAHQVVQVDGISGLADIFAVADEFHKSAVAGRKLKVGRTRSKNERNKKAESLRSK